MTHSLYVRVSTALMLAVFLCVSLCALPAEASHNDRGGYSSSVQRKINKLDDDIVKSFAIPVLFGVTLKSIYPDFGDPRGGGTREHEGQDIIAAEGTPIVSPTEAVVTRTGDGESSGLYVYTANPGGESFRYMHLDEIADIKAGDVLEVGDFIGTVGETGNAQGTTPHLHFEVREGNAKDPYDRIEKEFTLEEKMESVENVFENLDSDEEDMAEFLVEEYTDEFKQALNAGYDLPDEIKDELKARGIVSVSDLVKQLDSIIKSIPKVVQKDLFLGMQSTEVSLIQMYLIYEKTGPVASALQVAGATGYYGEITKAAVTEYQQEHDLEALGIYNAETREEMTK